jgi:CheY-like chemotaxis protein
LWHQNGIEALTLLRSESPEYPKPKIVLLDLNMPKMGGIEFLKEIRHDPSLSSLSVFVMTTSNEDSDKIEAFNLNVAGYILKPLSMDRFIAAVSTLNSYWTLCEYPQ